MTFTHHEREVVEWARGFGWRVEGRTQCGHVILRRAGQRTHLPRVMSGKLRRNVLSRLRRSA